MAKNSQLAERIPLGATASRSVVVTPELTVAAVYPALPAVYATPQMICLMEIAAADAVAPCLPAGWGTVGTLVDVKHLAATPLAMTITARATVVAVTGRTIRFECIARDGVDVVGRGWHERAAVDLGRFLTALESKLAASSKQDDET